MHFSTIIFCTFAINVFFSLIVYDELMRLPSMSTTMSILLGRNLSFFISIFIISFLLFFLPETIIVIILFSFKKYTFNHTKPIMRSYILINMLLIITYQLVYFIFISEFLVKLAFKRDEFALVYQSKLNLDKVESHMFFFEILNGLVSHVTVFIVMFFTTELIIAYYQSLSTMSFEGFCLKNQKALISTLLMATFYICFITYCTENLIDSQKSQNL